MKRLCDILFELSSEERLTILKELRMSPMKLSQMSKKLDSTVQETSRNLNRLLESKLLQRSADSSYNITPYGEAALNLLSGYEFLSDSSEYFTNHTITCLPLEFVERIGELTGSEFTNDVMTTFHHVNNMIEEAEEYLLFISEQILTSILHPETDALKRGIKVRAILPLDISPPPGSDKIFERLDESLKNANIRNRPEVKYVEKVDVCLCMSEKEVAGICFPTLDGRIDHLEFRSQEEAPRKWCKDLFEHYWKLARIV